MIGRAGSGTLVENSRPNPTGRDQQAYAPIICADMGGPAARVGPPICCQSEKRVWNGLRTARRLRGSFQSRPPTSPPSPLDPRVRWNRRIFQFWLALRWWPQKEGDKPHERLEYAALSSFLLRLHKLTIDSPENADQVLSPPHESSI